MLVIFHENNAITIANATIIDNTIIIMVFGAKRYYNEKNSSSNRN